MRSGEWSGAWSLTPWPWAWPADGGLRPWANGPISSSLGFLICEVG